VSIGVLIADDQALARTGLRAILEGEPDLRVVGEAIDGREAVAKTERLCPDIVLMDVRMPHMDGIEATRRIVCGAAQDAPRTRVIVLTTFDLDEVVYDALRAGASAFLLKNTEPESIVDAVRTVAAGEALLAPAVTRRVIEAFVRVSPATPAAPQGLSDLTPREHDVLIGLARGRSNAEIAADLVISHATVKTHVNRVLAKCRLRDRAQAVVFAYEAGLVRPGG
jgi:DNA-binding NarL/FixJ family response regulator